MAQESISRGIDWSHENQAYTWVLFYFGGFMRIPILTGDGFREFESQFTCFDVQILQPPKTRKKDPVLIAYYFHTWYKKNGFLFYVCTPALDFLSEEHASLLNILGYDYKNPENQFIITVPALKECMSDESYPEAIRLSVLKKNIILRYRVFDKEKHSDKITEVVSYKKIPDSKKIISPSSRAFVPKTIQIHTLKLIRYREAKEISEAKEHSFAWMFNKKAKEA